MLLRDPLREIYVSLSIIYFIAFVKRLYFNIIKKSKERIGCSLDPLREIYVSLSIILNYTFVKLIYK